MKTKRTAWLLLLILFFGLMCGLRLIRLGADPPKEISASMGYMSDPGGYVHNARNKILYGRWETDNWNIMYLTPIPHLMTYGIFKLFGIGLAQMNLVPAIFSCLCLICFFGILRSEYGRSLALAGTLLLGINYVFLIFSHAAVRVMPMLFFTLLSLVFLTTKSRDPRLRLFLAGGMGFLAYTAKGTFLFILPPILLGALLYEVFREKNKIKAGARTVIFYLLGFAAIFLIWLAFLYLPNKESFLPYAHSNSFWLTPHDHDGTLVSFLWGLLKGFWRRPLFFLLNMPVVTVLSSLYLLRFGYHFFTQPKKIRQMTWIAAIWMMSNSVWFAVIPYRAARHLYALIIPMILLAVDFIYDLIRSNQISKPERKPLLFFVFMFFWMIFAVSAAVILFSRPARLMMHARFWQTCGLSLAAALLIYIILKSRPGSLSFSLSRPLKIGLVSFLVCISAVFNLKAFAGWATEARYDRRDISRDLGRAFQNMRLGGLVSMVLALENRHEAHAYSTGYINRGYDFLERYRITHAIVTQHAEELGNYTRDFPQVMKDAKLLLRYPLWQTYVDLYDLYPPVLHLAEGVREIEGETFYGRNSIPRYDPDASQHYAYCIEKSGQGILLDLTETSISPGKYRVKFRLKTTNIPPTGTRIGRIDIVDESREKVLSRREIENRDFSVPGQYMEFEIPLSLDKDVLPTFRVYSTGRAELWFDKVTLEPAAGSLDKSGSWQ